MTIYKDRHKLKEHIDKLIYYIIEYNKIKYFINYSYLNTHDKDYIKNTINDIIDYIKELIKNLYNNVYIRCAVNKDTYLNDFSDIFNFTKVLIKRYNELSLDDLNKINNKDIIDDLKKIIKKLNDDNDMTDESIYKINNKNNIIIEIIDIYIK